MPVSLPLENFAIALGLVYCAVVLIHAVLNALVYL